MSWKLSSCRSDCDGQKVYYVNSSVLDGLNGMVINGIEITGKVINPDYCWKVLEDDPATTLELTGFKAFYSNCDYCVCGCCTEGIPIASVCATLDLTDVDIDLLGVDNVIVVEFFGVSMNLILATITGDFTGYTLPQLIGTIVDGITNGGSGFSAVASGNTIIVCTPADIGTEAIGSEVTLTFQPIYVLRSETPNIGYPILGYGSTTGDASTGRPIYVPASDSGHTNDLLYVPNGDVPQGTVNTPAWPAPYTFSIDLTVTLGAHSIFIPPDMSLIIYAGGGVGVGTEFELKDPITPTNGNLRGRINSYNQLTGKLIFNIITVTSPQAAPGVINWIFDIKGISPSFQSFGTINVYDIDSVAGTLTVNPASPIEVSMGYLRDGYYNSATKSIFFISFGTSFVSGVVKFDLTTSLFVPSAYLRSIGGARQLGNFDFNPITNNFYASFTNPNCITKFGMGDLGGPVPRIMNEFNCPPGSYIPFSTPPLCLPASPNCTMIIAGITVCDNPYAFSSSMTFNDDPASIRKGEIYYSTSNDNVFKIEPNASPFVRDIYGVNTSPANPLMTFSDYNNPPATGGGQLLDVNINGLYYYYPTKRLFVMRNISLSLGFEFQSYQIHDNTPGPTYGDQRTNVLINASKLVHSFPGNNPLLGGKFTLQPGVNQIFICAANSTVLIFDPATLSFSTQTVPTLFGVDRFAYQDDQVTPNFFGSHDSGNTSPATDDNLVVVSIETPSELISGIFVGELNCSPCLPEEIKIFERTIPDPVKIFYQIKESNCDIKVTRNFSNGYWKKVKELRYGITSCCDTINLENLWLNKQLSDLTTLLVPDITCNTPAPIPGACNWLPTKACQLIPDPTGGTSIVGVSGEALLFSRLVMLSSNGKFYYNQPTDTTTYQRCVGFATQDAVINQQVKILISGQIINTGWALIPGALYYASPNGYITSTVPVLGISQMVGIALSFNTLLVEIRQPIIL